MTSSHMKYSQTYSVVSHPTKCGFSCLFICLPIETFKYIFEWEMMIIALTSEIPETWEIKNIVLCSSQNYLSVYLIVRHKILAQQMKTKTFCSIKIAHKNKHKTWTLRGLKIFVRLSNLTGTRQSLQSNPDSPLCFKLFSDLFCLLKQSVNFITCLGFGSDLRIYLQGKKTQTTRKLNFRKLNPEWKKYFLNSSLCHSATPTVLVAWQLHCDGKTVAGQCARLLFPEQW